MENSNTFMISCYIIARCNPCKSSHEFLGYINIGLVGIYQVPSYYYNIRLFFFYQFY